MKEDYEKEDWLYKSDNSAYHFILIVCFYCAFWGNSFRKVKSLLEN